MNFLIYVNLILHHAYKAGRGISDQLEEES
jgi:hypothetical protein